MEVHRVSSVEWKPSGVVALATSCDKTQVAVAREDASIEIWNVAPGSVGWHCQLTIPGRNDYIISSLVWCHLNSSLSGPGRLFSASLDGIVSEWDLCSLQPKTVVESFGGSIWQMSVEPFLKARGTCSSKNNDDGDQDENETSSNATESDNEEEDDFAEQRVALACDDGCVRIYVIRDSDEIQYYKSFPRVKGRILSVAWSFDAKHIFAGGSDGCIRCWDITTSHELYRITAGIGGLGSGSDLCIWSLLVLRDGTLVSGDSTGTTQFWDSQQGTHLQAHTYHKGDVLALAAAPDHQGVFSTGSDGQVVQYKFVPGNTKSHKTTLGSLAASAQDSWVFVGSKHVHTHDVRALTVAVPLIFEKGEFLGEPTNKERGYRKPSGLDYLKWAVPGVPMLISGGDDAKLFAYPVSRFLDFNPHDICPAPQRVFVQLACKPKIGNFPIIMTQYSSWVDVSIINIGTDVELGKRKSRDFESKVNCKNDGYIGQGLGRQYGRCDGDNRGPKSLVKGIPPRVMARVKCKDTQNIICSVMSESGQLIAFSDHIKPSLYKLKVDLSTKSESGWRLKKKRLPRGLLPAHSMVFSADSTRLIVACNDGSIYVVDVDSMEILHTFDPIRGDMMEQTMPRLPITRLYTSGDGQWLAAINCYGDIYIFNLEILRQHWYISRLDACGVTAAGFHPSSINVLVVATASNHVYVLDVDAKQLGDWSKRYSSLLPRRFLEFPGEVIGLSFPASAKTTSVIIHSSKAMCLIDFDKPVRQDDNDLRKEGSLTIDRDRAHNGLANGHGKLEGGKLKHKSMHSDNNFVILPFRYPVHFLAHLSEHSILIVEKRWSDVLHKFKALPVYRHVFGT